MNDTDKSNLPITEELEKPDEEKVLQPVTVHVRFSSNSDSVKIVLQATNQENYVTAANMKLQLIQGRMYYVPIDTNANSDEYGNMKIYSDISEKIDIRYVKNGIACIIPLKHNIFISNNQQLCVLW
jgi:hypothetical protein